MCSCSFIIPYPYFDVNEIQHVFIAVFVVFIGCALLILFVFCIFMFFSIDFVFLLCHTWIYIGIPLFFRKNLCKADIRIPLCHMFSNSKRGVFLCIFLICIPTPSPVVTARNVPSPTWHAQLPRKVSGFSGSLITVPALWQPELPPISAAYSPKKHFGVELLYGIELNILDRSGTVDLDQESLCKLDYAIASMHAWNYRCGTRAENTEAFINVMKNPCVKILGHSDNTHYPVNYDALARAARETGTIFEINEASLAPYGYRGDTRENCFEILRCCRKYDLPLLLSSDSHGPEHIGDFTCAAEFVHQAMFPEQLILNNQIPRLKVFLQTRE